LAGSFVWKGFGFSSFSPVHRGGSLAIVWNKEIEQRENRINVDKVNKDLDED